MVLVRMRAAGFDGPDGCVGPLDLELHPGERAALTFESGVAAALAARLGAAIVKPSFGSVAIADFDTRVQSVHCKRLVAFVGHDPLPIGERGFERYVIYRAALWNVDPMRALAHAKLSLERLEGVHEAFAFPLAAALISNPMLLVLDRPAGAYAVQILRAAGPRAILSTHRTERDAAAFSGAGLPVVTA